MLPSNLSLLAENRRILLLQGPIGSFFQELADWLEKRGCDVFKINLNRGDEVFYSPNRARTFAYQGELSDFHVYLRDFIQQHHIQAVACFGDTRIYHTIAKNICQTLPETQFWAFEEGYFRPFWVTLERDGVNAHSLLPRDVAFFVAQQAHLPPQFEPQYPPVRGGFLPVAKLAMRYYGAMYWGRREFPCYRHHRFHEIPHYVKLWLISGCKRAYYAVSERWFANKIKQGRFGRFFVLPLQVFNDSQVRVHSDFGSVREFMLSVLQSFAEHAPEDTQLLIKHHPMDRGFIDYDDDIKAFIAHNPHLIGRVQYVHDVPLPVFLRYGVGMVTLNSTSGLSALIHNMPVKVLGRAHYDMAGLTDQQDLADFWRNPQKPEAALFEAYRWYHLNITQIHGSFYSKVNLPK